LLSQFYDQSEIHSHKSSIGSYFIISPIACRSIGFLGISFDAASLLYNIFLVYNLKVSLTSDNLDFSKMILYVDGFGVTIILLFGIVMYFTKETGYG